MRPQPFDDHAATMATSTMQMMQIIDKLKKVIAIMETSARYAEKYSCYDQSQ